MMDTKIVYERLVATAQAGITISYHAVGKVMGLNADDPCERLIIARALDEISCSENAQGRPMLSAVVVQPEIGYPGKGFFLLARELGLNTYCDDRSFFAHELKRVHEHWKQTLVEFPTPVYIPAPHRQSTRVRVAVH